MDFLTRPTLSSGMANPALLSLPWPALLFVLAACANEEVPSTTTDSGGSATGTPPTTSTGSTTGGTTGTGTTSGTTGTQGGPDPASILFQEDFEGTAEDTVPSGWHSFVGYVVDMNNSKSGQAYALADSTKPHQGAMSLHVLGGQTPAMLTYDLPSDTTTIYVRSKCNQDGWGEDTVAVSLNE